MNKFQKQGHVNVQFAPKKSFGEGLGAFLMILILGIPVFFMGLAIGFLQGRKTTEDVNSFGSQTSGS